MRNFFISTFLLFVLFSCNKNLSSLNDLFKTKEAINHTLLFNESEYLMGSSGKMLICDSILITLDYLNEKMFHIFDIKNNKYINNLGVKGQGPNEFLHPTTLINYSDVEFLSYDLLDNSLKKIRFDSLMNGIMYYEKMISFNSISNSVVIPTKYNNYAGFGLYESNMFKLIDTKGSEIGAYIDFPIEKDKKTIDHRNIALGYQGVLSINLNRDKLIYGALYGTILGIYNLNENSINQEFLFIHDYPQFIVQNDEGGMSSPLTKESIIAFRDIYVTEKYTYTLYSGKRVSDFQEKAFEAEDIFVFDWDGNPIIHYHLDIPINNIAIDAKNKHIYAISNFPEPILVKFNIDL